MGSLLRLIRRGGPKAAVGTVLALGGFGTAAFLGVAIAKTFTLKVAKNAHVTNQAGSTASESIAVNSHGLAVYELTGDSSRHPKCTRSKGCFGLWPPVKVSSRKNLSKAPGLRGRLGVWHRDGFFQVTLAGHPLYRYAGDSQKDSAVGQGIHSFGGTWHVIKATGAAGGMSGGTTSTMTTTTTTCAYPPFC